MNISVCTGDCTTADFRDPEAQKGPYATLSQLSDLYGLTKMSMKGFGGQVKEDEARIWQRDSEANV